MLVSSMMSPQYKINCILTNLGQEVVAVASFLVSARRKPAMCHESFCRCFYGNSGPWDPAVGINENLPVPVTKAACVETGTAFISLC